MRARAEVFPMQWSYRAVLVFMGLSGVVVAGLCLAEILGILSPGALIGRARDAERWVAVALGVLMQPPLVTALRHSRLAVDEHELRHLGFGLLCKPRTIRFADVARWGDAAAKRGGRRERLLIFGLHDGTRPTIKLSMYAGADRVVELLRERLGEPAPARITMAGVRFEE
jgi:hypothetical protein